MDVQLQGQGIPRSELTGADIEDMWRLFQEHYDQAEREIFQRDLDGKNWVILLRNEQAEIQGFSTLALYETVAAEQPLSVVFSGDTIIRPEFWGTPELPRTWIKTVLRASAGMVQPLYWLLISAGYKTYRFLPIFFTGVLSLLPLPYSPQAFRPSWINWPSSALAQTTRRRRVLPAFAWAPHRLRTGIAEVTPERLKDPHVAFFVARNPGYAQGDELVCLTHIHAGQLSRPLDGG